MTDPARRALLAKVHLGAKAIGLDDETRRDVIERVTARAGVDVAAGAKGKRSSVDCSTGELVAVIEELKRLGFDDGRKGKRWRKPSDKPHVRLVYKLWSLLKENGALTDPSDAALRSFVARQAKVSDPEFLDAADAAKVIEGLKAWLRRACPGVLRE